MRIRLVAAALRGGGRELGDVRLGDAELGETRDAAERGELLDACGRVAADRLAERAHRDRRVARVVAERRRQEDAVQRPVRQAVLAADRLRHRVREREHRAGKRLAAKARAAKELGARVAVVLASRRRAAATCEMS